MSIPSSSSRIAGAIVIPATLILASLCLSGCEAVEATPTCQEFAAMDPNTGLGTEFNSEQTDAVRSALDEEGLDDGDYNVTLSYIRIISYCNIYDGSAGNNQDVSIGEALTQ